MPISYSQWRESESEGEKANTETKKKKKICTNCIVQDKNKSS